MHIDTSLLREKFVLKETKPGPDGAPREVVAPSARMVVHLQAGELPRESYVIRCHNMHSCVRMTAQIIQNYDTHGPIMTRKPAIDWYDLWDHALSDYERHYFPHRWVCIYHAGKPIYHVGEYHPFFDIIEKFDHANNGDYEKSVKMAEDAFKAAGKDMRITYESNVALVALLDRYDGRCSMVLRGPDRTTTFNYALKPDQDQNKIHMTQGLSTSADFLEGVQLAFMVGTNDERLNLGLVRQDAAALERQIRDARKRLQQLNIQVNTMEGRYRVRYRPERPDFGNIILLAEKVMREKYEEERKRNIP